MVLEHRHEAEADEGTNHGREVILGAPGGAVLWISDIKGKGWKLDSQVVGAKNPRGSLLKETKLIA